MNYIELNNIVKNFNHKNILSKISLDIAAGDFVVLQGKNGAGKSTLLKIIIGLLQPNSGTVKLFGESPNQSNAKNQVGVVLQSVNLPDKTTVKELINLFCSYYSNSLTTKEIIELVNLQEKANDWANKLSGGQKQRLYFALALVGNPKLLILDEPTKNLDKSGCEDFWQQVKQCRQRNITILMVTNNQSDWQELDNLATRIITLENSQITENKVIENNRISSPKNINIVAPKKSPLNIFASQIKFEFKQWYHDILPIIGWILFSGLMTWLLPLEQNISKQILLIFAGITSLTFAIDKVGNRIAAERIEGWENLLRITPLSSIVYIASKIFVPILIITTNLIIISSLCAIKTIDQTSISEWFRIFCSLALGTIPFLICGVALGYLVKPKIFGLINGLSLIVAFITSGLLLPKILLLKYLLILSPFYHYSQLTMGSANLIDNSNWAFNILWLTWISCIFCYIAVWSYNREQAIQS